MAAVDLFIPINPNRSPETLARLEALKAAWYAACDRSWQTPCPPDAREVVEAAREAFRAALAAEQEQG